MKITYLDNSGFFVALAHTTLIFDYYNDKPVGEASLDGGVVTAAEIAAQENTYVFVSHSHYDHYNRSILNWQKHNEKLRYIFDSGVARGNDRVTHISEGGVYRDEGIEVKAFGSTDAGISLLVRAEGTTFFHAGDLNFWHWEEEADAEFIAKAERDFSAQLNAIEAEDIKIDVMFFPCDYRMGENGDAGAQRMIEALTPSVFVPMHFQRVVLEKLGCYICLPQIV